MKSLVLVPLLLLSVLLPRFVFAGDGIEVEPASPLVAETLIPAKPAIEESVSAELWSRATPPGGSSGAIYGRLKNTGSKYIKLSEITFTLARHIMVHETVQEGGMMKMKHRNLAIAPGESITLAPGGLHIMLMGLGEGLKEGCRYDVTFQWVGGSVSTFEILTGGFGQSTFPSKAIKPCQ